MSGTVTTDSKPATASQPVETPEVSPPKRPGHCEAVRGGDAGVSELWRGEKRGGEGRTTEENV